MRDKVPKLLKKSRFKGHSLFPSTKRDGLNGVFIFVHNDTLFRCIATDSDGWDHVSVSLEEKRCPTWEEMCFIKDLFFKPEECVVQYHPPSEDNINMHNFCLHLWKPQEKEIIMPPSYMV